MRVALVTYALRLGGVETLMHNLAAGLVEHGCDVSFVETEHRGEWSELTRELGYEVLTLPRRSWLTRARHCHEVAGCLSRFDVLLINDAPIAMAALSAIPPHVIAIPVLHTALPSMLGNATAAYGQWQRIVTVAPGPLAALRKATQIQLQQAVCIPNGVPMQAPRIEASHAATPLSVLYVGRLEQAQKNVLAIPAILRLAIDQGVDLLLEVVGEGPDASEMERRLQAFGVRYVLHGRLSRDKTIALMTRGDVLLMPSFYEGLPMTLLEAMSCGVTPIASRLVGSTDVVVESGVNGILIEPKDEIGFADALVDLALDRARLADLSRCAQEVVRERFSMQVMASSYLGLIRECSREVARTPPVRTGTIDLSLLGDFPRTPYALVRAFRKSLRMLGLYPAPIRDN